ncbi:outer membrane protein assembly factor BamE [Aquabacterium sp.]|uniref:outer membrane protein assembly factor BamE n=1 Tax=Aquabacterium sp. TaxID=1872578 RepID=UPI0035B20881
MLLSVTRRSLALVAVPALLLTLPGCSSWRNSSWSPETLFGVIKPYKTDVVQGNVVTQEVMAQIQPGLGRVQVRDILGAPLLADVFHQDRWDYVFTIRRQGVEPQKRKVTVYFKNDVVDHFEADALPSEHEFVASIDKPGEAKKPPQDLSDAQIAALPVPPKVDDTRKVPVGAVRTYPTLE